MIDISLEKLDMIKERTGVSYGEAREALETCDGDVVDAIIYIEEKKNNEPSPVDTSLEQFKEWLKNTIEKGNISRIKVKKDDKVIVDVPVNAGVAAGVIAVIWWPIAAILTATAVVSKVTIEITKDDGSIEVVNKLVKTTANDVKDKASAVAEDMKNRFKNFTTNLKNKSTEDGNIISNDEPVYQYTVKFDEENKEN
ncbi:MULTISPECIES: DUF4342 domain-containing protein [Clostridium]|uniref:DUF4342 domain-containing protein n=1 Tax=Clostridium cadaveris TaxID=1529 RepID=A0A1I2JER1_9CLOT|nr:DUF4342 domain-containing protein [Clostridium cadaveris]MDU4951313.1 DUF4342 domain-containing protein [Clostridium sp.]MDM8310756.1 DUF4342 domain-containing protein [Clostridium cadaveris]NME63843.1 DUF4342 domain-containing protein [Clostridium cadaveris]NWK10450.1 DUF4342 domain-containing protein [Clostridium cadaveris]PWL51831.1 MAG: DUF4342 domain-containing protein [Clostridium cadaveris]